MAKGNAILNWAWGRAQFIKWDNVDFLSVLSLTYPIPHVAKDTDFFTTALNSKSLELSFYSCYFPNIFMIFRVNFNQEIRQKQS